MGEYTGTNIMTNKKETEVPLDRITDLAVIPGILRVFHTSPVFLARQADSSMGGGPFQTHTPGSMQN